jgi:hypothetical protein
MKAIEISPVKVDKVTLIARFPENLNKVFHDYAKSLSGKWGNEKAIGSYPGKGKSGYKYAVNLNISGLPVKHKDEPNAGNLLFQVCPTSPWSDHSFRCEYNPDAIGPEGVEKVGKFFNELYTFFNTHGDFPDFWERFKITRIDLAVDLDHASLEDLIFYNARSQRWEVYPVENLKGKKYMETEYLGGISGAKRLRVYDKKVELRKNKKIHLPNERTRIEYTLKLSKPLQQLFEIKNPFLTLGIYEARALDEGNKKDWRWIQFLDSIRCRGLKGALSVIPKQTRRGNLKKLNKTAGFDWWNPDKVWETFPDALEKAGLGQGNLIEASN